MYTSIPVCFSFLLMDRAHRTQIRYLMFNGLQVILVCFCSFLHMVANGLVKTSICHTGVNRRVNTLSMLLKVISNSECDCMLIILLCI